MESEEAKNKRELRELEGKNIAYYQSLVSAWADTNMEVDKSLLTLSTAGIGVLVTIITTKELLVTEIWERVFLGSAFGGFLMTACLVLIIFAKNARHLEKVLDVLKKNDRSKEVIKDGKKNKFNVLTWLDMSARVSFASALFFAVLFGLFMAFSPYRGGENIMTNKKIVVEKSTIKKNSFVDIHKMAPSDMGKSLNNIENLAPQQEQSESGSSSSNSTQTTSAPDSSK